MKKYKNIIFSTIVVFSMFLGFMTLQTEENVAINVATRVADLNPFEISTRIGENVGKNPTDLHINSYNFPIQLDSRFAFENGATLRFTYEENFQIKASQLRIFHEESDMITKPEVWLDGQENSYRLDLYLEALKYLPQEEIFALCQEDTASFIVDIATDSMEREMDREIYYSQAGLEEFGDWYISLRIQPYSPSADGGFYGVGEDIVYVYYVSLENEEKEDNTHNLAFIS